MNHHAVYRLRNLTKTYGNSFQLEIGELDIAGNAIIALLGPTGAGKSTLLRLLAGIEAPSNGDIEFESRPLSAESPALRRRTAIVPQRPLMLTGTVRYNVQYGLRLRRAKDLAAQIDPLMTRLGLASFASRPAQNLSGGQMQLVAIARALVLNPDVLFVDEPTAHLDPAYVAIVEETIKEIREQRPMTVLWATHNLFQARRVATAVALLLNGRLVEAAPTETFFEHSRDPRTADFVQGKMIY